MRNIRKQNRAFTLIELIVVIAFITLLSAFSLCALTGARAKAQRITCIGNLKEIGIAFRTWAIAHDGRPPMAVSVLKGGDADDVGYRVVATSQRISSPTTGAYQNGSRGVSMMFLSMSNELSTPKLLFCPAEYENNYGFRLMASTFSGVYDRVTNSVPFTNDLNVSYFIGVDAQETSPQMLLAGDHNLGGNANPPTIAFCYMTGPTTTAGTPFVWTGTNWTADMGPAFMANQHDKQGNVAMADGSVECFNRSQLQDALKRSGDKGRSPGTFQPATGTTLGAGVNRIQLP
jgi:prepilin-type N-terminal cleavage/methylation domain-containing protein/prepilin-type processing-associated H-X9-DG protein